MNTLPSVRLCKECGVPRLVSKMQTWQDNGVILGKGSFDYRLLFFESDILDGLFREIERIIEVPIDRIVVEGKRKSTREYLENSIPRVARKFSFLMNAKLITRRLCDIATSFGFGDVRIVEVAKTLRKNGSHLALTIENPYSIFFFQGDVLAGAEAASGLESVQTTSKVEGRENLYRLDVHVGAHAPEFEQRLVRKRRVYKSGDINFERCPKCGIPLDVANCRWNFEEGSIIEPHDGRRMAIFNSGGLDAIFDELEAELGEEIPGAIIEAQRRFVKETFKEDTWEKEASEFRRMLALRGLGMLTDFEFDDRHLHVSIQNSVVPLLMVGMVQGLYELASGKETTTSEWDVSGDGDLRIKIENAA